MFSIKDVGESKKTEFEVSQDKGNLSGLPRYLATSYQDTCLFYSFKMYQQKWIKEKFFFY